MISVESLLISREKSFPGNKGVSMNYKKQSYDFKNLNPWLNLLRDDLDLKGVAMGFARIPARSAFEWNQLPPPA